jgi:hypothetical protein
METKTIDQCPDHSKPYGNNFQSGNAQFDSILVTAITITIQEKTYWAQLDHNQNLTVIVQFFRSTRSQ